MLIEKPLFIQKLIVEECQTWKFVPLCSSYVSSPWCVCVHLECFQCAQSRACISTDSLDTPETAAKTKRCGPIILHVFGYFCSPAVHNPTFTQIGHVSDRVSGKPVLHRDVMWTNRMHERAHFLLFISRLPQLKNKLLTVQLTFNSSVLSATSGKSWPWMSFIEMHSVPFYTSPSWPTAIKGQTLTYNYYLGVSAMSVQTVSLLSAVGECSLCRDVPLPVGGPAVALSGFLPPQWASPPCPLQMDASLLQFLLLKPHGQSTLVEIDVLGKT